MFFFLSLLKKTHTCIYTLQFRPGSLCGYVLEFVSMLIEVCTVNVEHAEKSLPVTSPHLSLEIAKRPYGIQAPILPHRIGLLQAGLNSLKKCQKHGTGAKMLQVMISSVTSPFQLGFLRSTVDIVATM